MLKVAILVAALAVIVGCSSPDSASSSESTNSVAAGSSASDLCADLQTIADADARTRDPAAQTWEEQREVVLAGAPDAAEAFDHAVADAAVDDQTVAADLATVRQFAAETVDAVRSSVTFEDFSARIRALDSSAATAAGARMNGYSIAACGFALVVDGS